MTHARSAPSAPPRLATRIEQRRWTLARGRAGEVVAASRPTEPPAEGASDREALVALGVRAHRAAPLVAGGAFLRPMEVEPGCVRCRIDAEVDAPRSLTWTEE